MAGSFIHWAIFQEWEGRLTWNERDVSWIQWWMHNGLPLGPQCIANRSVSNLLAHEWAIRSLTRDWGVLSFSERFVYKTILIIMITDPIEILPSRDVPVGNSGISSWESERCLSQAMVRNNGNGQNLLGICWEFWRNMQMRFTGTKCLIRHWEYFPVWILGMLCKILTRFFHCLIRHWEWWETAGNSLGNSTNYANEMFRYKMSDQTPGISPRLSQYKYWQCYARFLPCLSIVQCVWSDTGNTCLVQILEL